MRTSPLRGRLATVEDMILLSSLARLYGVEPRALNHSRSQSVILKRGANLKYPPLAFTEHGAIMAATVLNSERAVQMSIFVVRAFLKLREWVADPEVASAPGIPSAGVPSRLGMPPPPPATA